MFCIWMAEALEGAVVEGNSGVEVQGDLVGVGGGSALRSQVGSVLG